MTFTSSPSNVVNDNCSVGFILKRQICQRKGRLEILKVKIYGVEIIKFPSLSDKVFCLLAINIYCFECYLFFIKISDLSPVTPGYGKLVLSKSGLKLSWRNNKYEIFSIIKQYTSSYFWASLHTKYWTMHNAIQDLN